MSVRPLGPRVLVRKLAADSISAGGIHLVDYTKQHHRNEALRGEVIAVGPGRRDHRVAETDLLPHHIQLDMKPGDHVLFADHVGEEIEIHGVKHVLLHEDSVLAVVEA